MKAKKFFVVLLVLIIAAGIVLVPALLNNGDAGGGVPGGMGGMGGMGGPPGGGGGMPGGGTSASSVFTVRTADADIRTLQAYIEVNADIVSAQQVTVMPDAGGRLVSIQVNLGDTVQRGALLAQVDPSRPGTDYSLSPVYAPVSGMIVTSPQSVGTTVSTSTPLMTIAVNSVIEIEALIPEREVGQLRTGLQAEIRLEAFPGEIFTATVTQVSPVVDPVSRTKKIILRFNRNDSRFNPGMFVRVKLNTRSYPNVVSVPSDALVESRGRTIVYVLSGEADSLRVRAREVETGVTIDNETEIRAGLAAGEVVVVQGQQLLADGAQVRVIGGGI